VGKIYNMIVEQDTLYERQNLYLWFLLAFQGGALNAGGYLAVHRFVSHVTGFATLAGIAWGYILIGLT